MSSLSKSLGNRYGWDVMLPTSTEFYNTSGVSPRNDPASPESAFAVDRIRKQLEQVISPNIRALDLGCNAGRFTFAMESMGARSVGVDCAEVPLKYAKNLALKWNSTCEFKQCILPYLPFDDNSFDLALFPMNIVEHSKQDMGRLAKELSRVLVDGGLFCMTMKDEADSDDMIVSHCEIPGKGSFEYQTYAWSVESANQVIGEWLTFHRQEQLEHERVWMEFKMEDAR